MPVQRGQVGKFKVLDFLDVHPQVLLDVLLDGDPAIIDVDTWAENVDPLKHALVLLQDETDERHSFARLAGPKEDARAWHQAGAPRGPRLACWCTQAWGKA